MSFRLLFLLPFCCHGAFREVEGGGESFADGVQVTPPMIACGKLVCGGDGGGGVVGVTESRPNVMC